MASRPPLDNRRFIFKIQYFAFMLEKIPLNFKAAYPIDVTKITKEIKNVESSL